MVRYGWDGNANEVKTMSASGIEKTVEILAAKEALHELEMAYCRGVDRRDANLLRSIFFEDAVEEHGEMFRGRAYEFVDWVFGTLLGQYENTTHYVLNEWYKIDGEKAEGETHRVSYHRYPPPNRTEVIAACRTFNSYERRNGVWKITHRSVVRDWITKRTVDDALYQGSFGMPLSEPGATDCSYKMLKMFGRHPG